MCATPSIETKSSREIDEAAALLQEGRLVAFPTETVYGLGADATNSAAVAGIFEAKRRPMFNPLIVHVLNIDAVKQYVTVNARARTLAEAVWPGPLTMVLPALQGNGISGLVSAGLKTLAVRVPAHPLARMLLDRADRPIAAPSANISGRVSPTRARHVHKEFANSDVRILDGGRSITGLESTIVDLTSECPLLLRPGTITRAELQSVLDVPVATAETNRDDHPVAPGQLASHYAPAAAVRLNAADAGANEALIGFGPHMPKTQGISFNLSVSGDLRQAAANLFDALREMDQPGVSMIAVMPIPAAGIGEAINDRLRRAAAMRT